MRNIFFIIPPRVHLLDINGPAHLFYEAKGLGVPLECHFASINGCSTVQSSSGLSFSKLQSLESLSPRKGDFIFIPGSEQQKKVIDENPLLLQFLREWHDAKLNICSICVGAYWLAEAGILNNKKSTTHWKYLDEFKNLYPMVNVLDDHLFTIEKNLYMSAGVSSGMDLTLHILEELYGFDLALKVAKEVVYFFRRGGNDPQISTFLKYRNHIDRRIHNVQDFIATNINKRFTLDDIANHVSMSKRNMARSFKKATGKTPGEYIKMVRIERAKHLMANNLKLDQVARECGFRNVSQLRRLLKNPSRV